MSGRSLRKNPGSMSRPVCNPPAQTAVQVDALLRTYGIFHCCQTAQRACQGSRVHVNGLRSKASTLVGAGGLILVPIARDELRLWVLAVPPSKSISRHLRSPYVGIGSHPPSKPLEASAAADS